MQSLRQVILIGAGHTHLHTVRHQSASPFPNTELTLISSFPEATYSGMLPGVLAGKYRPDSMRIPLQSFCEHAGVRLVTGSAVCVDAKLREVTLADGRRLPWDVLSVGVGSSPQIPEGCLDAAELVGVKPMQTFLERLTDRLRDVSSGIPEVVVVGGGAAGVEMALACRRYLQCHSPQANVTLISSATSVPSDMHEAVQRHVLRALADAEITLRTGIRAEAIRDRCVVCSNGGTVPADIVLWCGTATATKTPRVVGVGLPEAGFLPVDRCLRVMGQAELFAVGDCAEHSEQSIERSGVHAVRQGPVLTRNIAAVLAGRKLVPYRPRKGSLYLLNLADGRAVGQWKRMTFCGRWAMTLKDGIDQAFINQFRGPC